MKKIPTKILLLALFNSPLLVFATGCSVQPISALNHHKKPGGLVFAVSDSGSFQDKSFNQQVYEASTTFVNDAQTTKKNQFNSFSFSFNKFQPNTQLDIIRGDQAALSNDASTLVVAGYSHEVPLQRFLKTAQSDANNMRIILLDSGFVNAQNPPSALTSHVSGLIFPGEIAAFKAGILAIFYILHHGDLYRTGSDTTIKVGSYVGQDFLMSTSYFMWGMKQAFEWYNTNKEAFKTVISKNWGLTSFISSEWGNNLPNVKLFTYDNPSVDSFIAGAGGPMTWKLLNDGCQFIFPVAGPQAQDVLNVFFNQPEDERKKLRMIGVDSDQTLQFPDARSPESATDPDKNGTPVIITSAKKDIYRATYDGLTDAYTFKAADMTKPDQCWGYGCNYWTNKNITLPAHYGQAADGIFSGKFNADKALKAIYDKFSVYTATDESLFSKNVSVTLKAGLGKIAKDFGKNALWKQYANDSDYQVFNDLSSPQVLFGN